MRIGTAATQASSGVGGTWWFPDQESEKPGDISRRFLEEELAKSDTANGRYLLWREGMMYQRTAQRNVPVWIGWVTLLGLIFALVAPLVNLFVPSPTFYALAGIGLLIVAGALGIGKRRLTAR
jgi:hypothetical protein